MYFKIINFEEHKIATTSPHPHQNPILPVQVLSQETLSGDSDSAALTAISVLAQQKAL